MRQNIVGKRYSWRPPHTIKTKQKISKALVGRHLLEETRKKISESLKGSLHPHWKGGPKRSKCVDCSKEITYGFTYCSSCAQKGERNPNWNGGNGYEPYSSKFTDELKLRIRTRDNFTCQKCGRLEVEEKEELGRVLAVHHIDGDKSNNGEDNLITLCLSCNNQVNHYRSYWQGYLSSFIPKINKVVLPI